jgi:phosphate transport system substrate-binding protein
VRPRRILIASASGAAALARAWAQEIEHRDRSVSILVEEVDSEKAIGRLIDRRAEIAVCTRAIGPQELQRARANGVQPREYKVALDAIAVIVHPSNRVRELTLDQLRAIYGGEVESWKDVGGGSRSIVPVWTRPGNEMSQLFLERLLTSGAGHEAPRYVARGVALRSSKAAAQRVASEPGAIGYLELRWYDRRRHGLVAIAAEERGPFFRPAMGTLLYHQYPLSRPVLFYADGRPKGKVKEFLDFALSSDGQLAAARFGFVPMIGARWRKGT